VREAFGDFRYPLTTGTASQCEAVCEGSRLSLAETADRIGTDFLAPPGWRGRVELAGARL
jgi:hypothetical protein